MKITPPFFTAQANGVALRFYKSQVDAFDPPWVVIEDLQAALGQPYQTLERLLKENGLSQQIDDTLSFKLLVPVEMALKFISGAVGTPGEVKVPLASAEQCVDGIAAAVKHWLATLDDPR